MNWIKHFKIEQVEVIYIYITFELKHTLQGANHIKKDRKENGKVFNEGQ